MLLIVGDRVSLVGNSYFSIYTLWSEQILFCYTVFVQWINRFLTDFCLVYVYSNFTTIFWQNVISFKSTKIHIGLKYMLNPVKCFITPQPSKTTGLSVV